MEGSPYSSYTPLPTEAQLKPRRSRKWIWITFIILGLAGIVVSLFLNRVPANAAAMVNGNIITKDEVNQRVAEVVAVYSTQGGVLEDRDLLDELHSQALQTAITDSLLLKEAEQLGIEVLQVDVDKKFDTFVLESKESIQVFAQALAGQGLSIDIFKQHLKNQLIIEKLVEKYAKSHGVAVSESEMRDLYTQLKNKTPDIVSYDAMESELRTRVTRQKTDKLMIDYVNDLRTQAKIRTY